MSQLYNAICYGEKDIITALKSILKLATLQRFRLCEMLQNFKNIIALLFLCYAQKTDTNIEKKVSISYTSSPCNIQSQIVYARDK